MLKNFVLLLVALPMLQVPVAPPVPPPPASIVVGRGGVSIDVGPGFALSQIPQGPAVQLPPGTATVEGIVTVGLLSSGVIFTPSLLKSSMLSLCESRVPLVGPA